MDLNLDLWTCIVCQFPDKLHISVDFLQLSSARTGKDRCRRERCADHWDIPRRRFSVHPDTQRLLVLPRLSTRARPVPQRLWLEENSETSGLRGCVFKCSYGRDRNAPCMTANCVWFSFSLRFAFHFGRHVAARILSSLYDCSSLWFIRIKSAIFSLVYLGIVRSCAFHRGSVRVAG